MSRQATLEEWKEIITVSEAAHTDPQIAIRTGWSISTLRKWRGRYRKQGQKGLNSIMGRPLKGALSTYSQGVRDWIKHMSRKNPGWGAKTLHPEMSLQAHARKVP